MSADSYIMDPIKVTDDLPILSRLSKREKMETIHIYQNFLRKKSYDRIISLRDVMKNRLYNAEIGRTVYHNVLEDQYRRILNIIEHTLMFWPMNKWGASSK